jgi:hypothetical protein
MKKLLILAYDFPPYVSVGGLRPYSWYRYLHEYNVYPVVIKRQWTNTYKNKLDYIAPGTSNNIITEETPQGTLIKVPYLPTVANRIMLKYGEYRWVWIRRMITAFYEIMQWFFFIGPKKHIYTAADAYLKNNSVDAIMATGDPFILFKYAAQLSKKHNIPFIADYRDPWSQNNERQGILLKQLHLYFEKKYTNQATVITTVSGFMKQKIQQIFPLKNIELILNGYDENNLPRNSEIKSSTHLNIGFAGSIYPWHHIRNVLTSIRKFHNDFPNAPLKINFFGININLQTIIENEFPEISSLIIIYPKMNNREVMKNLATQHAFLLFNDYSIVGTKIYDYLALQRKIIFCFSNDAEANSLKEKYYKVHELDATHRPQEELIQSTHAGVIVENADQLYDVWKDLHEEFERTGSIACHTQHIEQYSRKYQAGKLAEIIYEIRNSKDYLI